LSLVFVASTRNAPLKPIYAAQGSGDKSPLENQQVTIEGVVTGDFQLETELSGFFVQDAQGDGDTATSDGLFVYVPGGNNLSRVDVGRGDVVRVSGQVVEFKGQTQLDRVTRLEVLQPNIADQNAPPQAVEVRLPLDTASALERYEGMLVTFPQTLTVSGNYGLSSYGELVLSSGGRLFNPTNGNVENPEPNALRRIVLDDGSTRRNPNPLPYLDEQGTRRAGDTVEGLTGVLGFGFDTYRVQPVMPPKFLNANPQPTKPAAVGGDIKVATFNVKNYFTTLQSDNPKARGARTAAEFARQSAKIVAALRAIDADVVGLVEIENNGNKAVDHLLDKLNAVYGKAIYAAVPDPAQGTGSDAIKVAFIYKPQKVARVGASVSYPNIVFDRVPVAQTFRPENTPSSTPFTTVVNHFKSKGSCPETGDKDLGQGCWNNKRVQQAQELLKFVAQLEKRSGGEVLVLGDLNAYGEEDPIRALRAGGLVSLNLRIPAEKRYSFVFDAQAGDLDHALATPKLAQQVTGITKWHINSDEPEVARDAGMNSSATPFRSSDHDPLILGLRFNPGSTMPVSRTTVARP
jgi:predicted extracellular nuclease